jgi:hypothetical protein
MKKSKQTKKTNAVKRAKRYVGNIVCVPILTVAAVFLTLARVPPSAIVDETERMVIF